MWGNLSSMQVGIVNWLGCWTEQKQKAIGWVFSSIDLGHSSALTHQNSRPSSHHSSGLTPMVHRLLYLNSAIMPSSQGFHPAHGLFGTSQPSYSHESIPLLGSFPFVYLCVHSTIPVFLENPNTALITGIPSVISLPAVSLCFSFLFPKMMEITPTLCGCCEGTKDLTEFCSQ